jgi:hypothetical protein
VLGGVLDSVAVCAAQYMLVHPNMVTNLITPDTHMAPDGTEVVTAVKKTRTSHKVRQW